MTIAPPSLEWTYQPAIDAVPEQIIDTQPTDVDLNESLARFKGSDPDANVEESLTSSVLPIRDPLGTTASSQPTDCCVCGVSYASHEELVQHARNLRHKTIQCQFQPCDFLHVPRSLLYFDHLRSVHPHSYSCSECKKAFTTQWDMGDHATETGHAALACSHPGCGKSFSRLDTFTRHKNVHRDGAKRFPCDFCKTHRGKNGFKRKDHLTQHLRGYHNHHTGKKERTGCRPLFARCCPHKDCAKYRAIFVWTNLPFKGKDEYTKHMKEVHRESDFPCPEPGCDRIGEKGYFVKANLRNHLVKKHDKDPMTLRIEAGPPVDSFVTLIRS
ncbi:hypothetical protein EJ04DRAFT_467658 [Polyplosphaeria fusca]|uniref:C2H2-type domain-containing protein n=1 Tax=Polyplosphaeria fusca TaxID=682080 RepID=A0A9P4QWQ2_9PLEO|nr:hypothetical protein EJ04DRAFT_467658 [Polyplosphaeria fusca]